MNRYILALSALVFLGSCKKDREYETHYPKSYLPAYPGSYWEYSDGSKILTSDEFEIGEIFESESNYGQTELTTCTLIETPKFLVYQGKYLKNYTVYYNPNSCYSRVLLGENLGWYLYW